MSMKSNLFVIMLWEFPLFNFMLLSVIMKRFPPFPLTSLLLTLACNIFIRIKRLKIFNKLRIISILKVFDSTLI